LKTSLQAKKKNKAIRCNHWNIRQKLVTNYNIKGQQKTERVKNMLTYRVRGWALRRVLRKEEVLCTKLQKNGTKIWIKN